ncbi:MAG: Gfo/Idh/MocA family oxidoreductase [Proteobacteria bacterium]|nr:Gfo/Idh/MocA family oxidoreductase [Pseudomonadota bacterium]
MSINAGLVGFGLAGRVFHAPLLEASGIGIVGVVSRQREAVRAALPATRVFPDLDALLAEPRLDLVVIATPNDLHEAQALAALAAGKHVVVDKPMALSIAGADRLMQAAAAASLMLSAFHNRRWDSDFLTLRGVLEAGTLGAVQSFEARWNRYRPAVVDRWRESAAHGGGLLHDLGTHLVDQALLLFGMPDWVQADILAQRAGATVEDAFDLRMGKGRLRVVLGATTLAAEAGPRYRVHGELGSYTSDALDPQEEQARAGMPPTDAAFGLDEKMPGGHIVDGATGAIRSVPAVRGRWIEYYRAVRRAIEARRAAAGASTGPPAPIAPIAPVEPAAARRVLQVIEAARQSSASGSRVPLDGRS